MSGSKLERLKEGFQNITPAQLLEAKMWGGLGAFFGILFALVMTIVSGVGYFAPWLGFVAFLQVVDIGQTWKQHGQIKAIERLQEKVLEQQGGVRV